MLSFRVIGPKIFFDSTGDLSFEGYGVVQTVDDRESWDALYPFNTRAEAEQAAANLAETYAASSLLAREAMEAGLMFGLIRPQARVFINDDLPF